MATQPYLMNEPVRRRLNAAALHLEAGLREYCEDAEIDFSESWLTGERDRFEQELLDAAGCFEVEFEDPAEVSADEEINRRELMEREAV